MEKFRYGKKSIVVVAFAHRRQHRHRHPHPCFILIKWCLLCINEGRRQRHNKWWRWQWRWGNKGAHQTCTREMYINCLMVNSHKLSPKVHIYLTSQIINTFKLLPTFHFICSTVFFDWGVIAVLLHFPPLPLLLK